MHHRYYGLTSQELDQADVCRDCGVLVVDKTAHDRNHQREGLPEPLPDSGANDVPPLPPRG